MSPIQDGRSRFTRRGLLGSTLSLAGAGAASLLFSGDAAAGSSATIGNAHVQWRHGSFSHTLAG